MKLLRLSLVAAVVALGVGLVVPASRAELVWSPQTGWRVEGGVLAEISGVEGRSALELMNQAREAEERGNTRRALAAYRKVTRDYGKSIFAPEAYFRTAQIRLRERQFYKAFEAYQAIVWGYPNYEKFGVVIGEQYRIATALADGARNRSWMPFFNFPNRDRAVEYYEQVILNAPYSDYAPLALMNVARLHKRLGNDEEAIDALDRMVNAYPQSILTPDAYLRLAQTHASLVEGAPYDQKSTREAITYFEDFLIQFPGDANVGEAEQGLDAMKTVLAQSRMVIGDFYYFKRRNYTAARVLYNEAITTYPDSAVASLARQRLNEIETLTGGTPAAAAVGAPAPAPEKKRKRFFFF